MYCGICKHRYQCDYFEDGLEWCDDFEMSENLLDGQVINMDILDNINKMLTKGYTRVPLLTIIFDLKRYKENGAKNSCMTSIHPVIEADAILKSKVNDVICPFVEGE